jgi:hypothetical protein
MPPQDEVLVAANDRSRPSPYAGGIPLGFHLPNDQYGSRYNGALRTIYPEYLLSNLPHQGSRRQGHPVLTGSEKYFRMPTATSA